MRKITIGGNEVTTNLGENYAIGDGNDTKTMEVRVMESGESEYAFVARLAKRYKRVTLKQAKTCVRGYYKVYALVRDERQ